ncbi:MAG: nucleotidyl transferase AbiEii/AbiGii toxin family protein [Saprospiraceae bacterium]|nr:nucleotidyl transferase AbiEii/AbiGii toxin family protein [Candidatus Brachybacter algidus]
MKLPSLAPFILVGGTALSLQYGHRMSIDLDFFGTVEFNLIQKQ